MEVFFHSIAAATNNSVMPDLTARNNRIYLRSRIVEKLLIHRLRQHEQHEGRELQRKRPHRHDLPVHVRRRGRRHVGIFDDRRLADRQNGDLFYITNTHCILTLSGVTLKNEDPDGYLLRVVGNSASHGWGTAGSNGAQVEFTADAQTLEGNILVDTI